MSPDQGLLFCGLSGTTGEGRRFGQHVAASFFGQWRAHEWMPTTWQLVEPVSRAIYSPTYHRKDDSSCWTPLTMWSGIARMVVQGAAAYCDPTR